MDGAVGGIGMANGHFHTTYEVFATRMFEGVPAEGKRITTTLEIGALGNDHEIVVEDESWFSSQLHVLVYARVSDPRIGTTVNKLVDVNLAEPDPKLFIVPPDFVIEDRTPMGAQ